jgi:hypothetical protein
MAYLLLKWGTIKGWSDMSDEQVEIIQRWHDEGVSISAMTENVTEKKKEIICELIDTMKDGEITNDWSGESMTRDEAKKYIIEYRS